MFFDGDSKAETQKNEENVQNKNTPKTLPKNLNYLQRVAC